MPTSEVKIVADKGHSTVFKTFVIVPLTLVILITPISILVVILLKDTLNHVGGIYLTVSSLWAWISTLVLMFTSNTKRESMNKSIISLFISLPVIFLAVDLVNNYFYFGRDLMPAVCSALAFIIVIIMWDTTNNRFRTLFLETRK
jgi:hypothetical protein